MQPTQELVDAIYRQRVLRARATPPGVKLLDGPRLFERACRIMLAGIRDQFPNADESRIREILREHSRYSNVFRSRDDG